MWWASQGKNHAVAIKQGTLWTTRYKNGRMPEHRSLIHSIRPGDVVFHYDGPALRAVSVASTQSQPCTRPDGYPKPSAEYPDDGWLVQVEPVVDGLYLHRDRLTEILPHGLRGPLDRTGSPAQKYLSPIDDTVGSAILTELDTVVPPTPMTRNAETETAPGGGKTDVLIQASGRVEQRGLRAYLLASNKPPSCGLCGRILPERLLVAGHIKPRSQCSETERWNYASVAFLTCLLGCDVLFEHGYLTVDDTGTITAGRPATDALVPDLDCLIGTPCPAYAADRAPAFAHHRSMFVFT